MSESEQARLSFLAQAFLNDPSRSQFLRKVAVQPSPPLKRALRVLAAVVLRNLRQSEGKIDALREEANKLMKASGDAERSAGLALHWAIQNRELQVKG